MMDIALYVLAALLIIVGMAGAVLPTLPGIPMIFGGIWLTAAVDQYRHLGMWWLLIIGALGSVGVIGRRCPWGVRVKPEPPQAAIAAAAPPAPSVAKNPRRSIRPAGGATGFVGG